MAYLWASNDGSISEADYNPATDTLTNEQVLSEILDALQQFGHSVDMKVVSDDKPEVYTALIDGDLEIIISAKGTTPGGRTSLSDEQRIQQRSSYINYAFTQSQSGKKVMNLGVYKRDNQTIFCAWKLKGSSAASPSNPISKQIKITTIAQAMKFGFVQQDKGNGEYACAFRKEFIYFYINNLDWFHNGSVHTLSEHVDDIPAIDVPKSDIKEADNIILYGVPGCGKSHKIKTEYCDNEKYMERIVFHPDYTYSDFVGQILPQNIDGHISYPFTPGPFTRILKKAVEDEANKYFLIIEELNRGNAPAIFGEVFQLLDRNGGISEYGINNADIALAVYGDACQQIKIPKNLFLLATMNTADQNIFTLDTAFKRRWRMRSVSNDISLCFFAKMIICNTGVSWATFLEKINELIVNLGEGNIGNEDKRLGAFFLQQNELNDIEMFSEKVLMYLWNDAFKYDHDKVFKGNYRTLDELIDGFKAVKFGVFLDSIDFNKAEDELVVPDIDNFNNSNNQVNV